MKAIAESRFRHQLGELDVAARIPTLNGLDEETGRQSGLAASGRAASLCFRRRYAARGSATTVLPVPAEPATRARDLYARSTNCRCEGCRKTDHLSQG